MARQKHANVALPLLSLVLALLVSPSLCAPVDPSDTPPADPPVLPPAPAPAPDPATVGPLYGNPCSVEWFQVHGWLMWAGFGVFMPIGIITSRHMQTVTTAWFHIHISCMALAIACICAGCGIAFNKFEAIPETPLDDAAAVHVYFGCATFILACLNFVLGLIRPHKGKGPRVWWYAFHFTFGTCVVAFAWYCIFSGMDIYEENWVNDLTGIPDLHVLKMLFAIQISIMAFVYLLLGRWDYLLGQKEEGAPLDGLRRFTSTWHVSSLAKLPGSGDEHSHVNDSLKHDSAA